MSEMRSINFICMMSRIQSFAPISNKQATILILGSMPGEASLRAGQYYAHPRNHFWRLMAELVGLDVAAPYAERVAALNQAGVAVWDVLQSCVRAGSLDSDIEKSSLQANDFRTFFSAHRDISQVFFNGSAAEQIYRRHVLPALEVPQMAYLRLPSSSPANAGYSFERKLEQWRAVLRG
jgi:double-stranded uracil-DNA glycosylase